MTPQDKLVADITNVIRELEPLVHRVSGLSGRARAIRHHETTTDFEDDVPEYEYALEFLDGVVKELVTEVDQFPAHQTHAEAIVTEYMGVMHEAHPAPDGVEIRASLVPDAPVTKITIKNVHKYLQFTVLDELGNVIT